MGSELVQKLAHINAQLASQVTVARMALCGEHRFGAAEVRRIREPLTEMEPLMAECSSLRGTQPGIAAQVELYKSQLLELQRTVEKLRVSLIVQKTRLETSRAKVNAASQWCEAFHQTR
jgi:hypothetical protein